jgi:hypothetical protein
MDRVCGGSKTECFGIAPAPSRMTPTARSSAAGYDPPLMSRPDRAGTPGWKFYVAVWLAMMAVHQDFWNWRDATLVFGFVPVGLAYHLGYSILASVVMAVLVRRAWPAHLEALAARDGTPVGCVGSAVGPTGRRASGGDAGHR